MKTKTPQWQNFINTIWIKFFCTSFIIVSVFILSNWVYASGDSLKYSIELSPIRLLNGNFQLTYDIAIKEKFSISITGLGTYASRGGYGDNYLKNQEGALSFIDQGLFYSPKMITGFGIMVQPRHYLLPNVDAPVGLYVAPYFSYRKVWITSEAYVWEGDQYITKDKIRNLDIFSAGVLIGGRLGVIKNLFSIDIYGGAGLKLSKYTDDSNFTRYKRIWDLDYSGVTPTIGLSIGILK